MTLFGIPVVLLALTAFVIALAIWNYGESALKVIKEWTVPQVRRVPVPLNSEPEGGMLQDNRPARLGGPFTMVANWPPVAELPPTHQPKAKPLAVVGAGSLSHDAAVAALLKTEHVPLVIADAWPNHAEGNGVPNLIKDSEDLPFMPGGHLEPTKKKGRFAQAVKTVKDNLFKPTFVNPAPEPKTPRATKRNPEKWRRRHGHLPNPVGRRKRREMKAAA